jgi:hypothetical protein
MQTFIQSSYLNKWRNSPAIGRDSSIIFVKISEKGKSTAAMKQAVFFFNQWP